MNETLWQCVLASGSSRRRELLQQIGIEPHQVIVPSVDESPARDELPENLVERLAIAKCNAVKKQINPDDMIAVLAADTVVAIDGRCLGKPSDYADFIEMMELLSGQTHSVWTGVCVSGRKNDLWKTAVVSVETKVRMGLLGRAHWDAYWSCGEPIDKAGGYGIQGRGALLVESIEGSYSNVVGLPLREVSHLLHEIGWDLWLSNIATKV